MAKHKQRLLVEANSIVPQKRSGIGHFTLELLRELDRERYSDVEVIAFGCIGEREALEAHGFHRIKIKILPFPHKVMAVLSRLSRGPSLEIFLGKGTFLFPNFRNLPVGKSTSLTYIHDVSFKLFPEFTQPTNLRYILGNIDKWIARADILITISEQSKREIVAELNVEESKVAVTPLAVNPSIFYPRPRKEVQEICSLLGVEPDNYFLFIGNIEPRKNLEFLVRTYMNDPKLKSYPLLIIGGDGWLNEHINRAMDEARKQGYKIIRNKRYIADEELPALMTGATGLVYPSHHEGFGLPVVQALACGTRVAVSDIPVMHETMGSNQGLYFDPHDSGALSKALQQMISGGKVEVGNLTTWDSLADEVIKLMNRPQTQ